MDGDKTTSDWLGRGFPHMCLLETVIHKILWGLTALFMGTAWCGFACVLASVCVCVCWRKSKALFPMHVIIPGWGGRWSRAGLPLHQRVFSSHTVVRAHGWPGLPLCLCVCVSGCVCVYQIERERATCQTWDDGSNFLIAFVFKPSCFLPVQMEMMQQWEPLVVAYIKEQMEPREPIRDRCGGVWRKRVQERRETDKKICVLSAPP